jgi:hypothetical protein
MSESSRFAGRRVQAIGLTPELVLDLLRDVEHHQLAVPESHRGELDGAKAVGLGTHDGLIYLFLEKECLRCVAADSFPSVHHHLVQPDATSEPVFTDEWGKTEPHQSAAVA